MRSNIANRHVSATPAHVSSAKELTMRPNQTFPFAARLASVAIVLSACGAPSPRPATGAPGASPPPPKAAASESAVPVTVLPHPAFAGAGPKGARVSSIADVVERALPSVVNISSTKVARVSTPFDRFFGPGGPHRRPERGLGSGVVVSADGVIVTNNHVVEGAKEIRVMTHDRRELTATVVGMDPKSDLAVIRVKGQVKDLVPIRFGDSSRLRLGDVVLAIGNPFGVGQTVTMGIVSAKGRANVGIVDYEDFIQTDAAINPGNSGGALIDMEGNLVGVNTAILSRTGGSMGIGFAIPATMVKPIMDSLLAHGKVVRGWLGVIIQELDAELAKAMKLPVDTRGVLIADVADTGPAKKAGLRRGDVVQKIDGVVVRSPGKLRNAIAAAGAGRDVVLDVLRNGKNERIEIRLAEMPNDPRKAVRGGETIDGALEGLELESLDVENRRKFGIAPSVRGGLVIVDVAAGSPSHRAGLRPGDVILEVNRARVRSVEQLKRAYRRSKDKVLLLVHREGGTVFIVIKR